MKILRARVIEGSLPMPESLRAENPGITENNYEILCPYSKENFQKLIDIGRKEYRDGDLSKMEILAWDGGAANHDVAHFLWNFRPDLYNFEHLPPSVYDFFSKEDALIPAELAGQGKVYYDRFWRPLQFGISLGVYESYMDKKPSLDDQMKAADTKVQKPKPEPVQSGPER